METKRTRLRISELNPHLLCALCGGYLIDATTIVECLHSFCKTCIVRYLETSNYCPICEVLIHKKRPWQNIRLDHTLQNVVYKLVPGLFKHEMQRRREYYEKNPPPGGSNGCSEQVHSAPERIIFSEDEKFSVTLEFSPNGRPIQEPKSESLDVVTTQHRDKRHLLCPANLCIGHLKKFVRLKYSLPEHYMIDLFYSDEPLEDFYSLMDVAYIYSWRRESVLTLYYSFYQPPSKRRKVAAAAASTSDDKSYISPGVKPETKSTSSATATSTSTDTSSSSAAVEAAGTESSFNCFNSKRPTFTCVSATDMPAFNGSACVGTTAHQTHLAKDTDSSFEDIKEDDDDVRPLVICTPVVAASTIAAIAATPDATYSDFTASDTSQPVNTNEVDNITSKEGADHGECSDNTMSLDTGLVQSFPSPVSVSMTPDSLNSKLTPTSQSSGVDVPVYCATDTDVTTQHAELRSNLSESIHMQTSDGITETEQYSSKTEQCSSEAVQHSSETEQHNSESKHHKCKIEQYNSTTEQHSSETEPCNCETELRNSETEPGNSEIKPRSSEAELSRGETEPSNSEEEPRNSEAEPRSSETEPRSSKYEIDIHTKFAPAKSPSVKGSLVTSSHRVGIFDRIYTVTSNCTANGIKTIFKSTSTLAPAGSGSDRRHSVSEGKIEKASTQTERRTSTSDVPEHINNKNRLLNLNNNNKLEIGHQDSVLWPVGIECSKDVRLRNSTNDKIHRQSGTSPMSDGNFRDHSHHLALGMPSNFLFLNHHPSGGDSSDPAFAGDERPNIESQQIQLSNASTNRHSSVPHRGSSYSKHAVNDECRSSSTDSAAANSINLSALRISAGDSTKAAKSPLYANMGPPGGSNSPSCGSGTLAECKGSNAPNPLSLRSQESGVKTSDNEKLQGRTPGVSETQNFDGIKRFEVVHMENISDADEKRKSNSKGSLEDNITAGGNSEISESNQPGANGTCAVGLRSTVNHKHSSDDVGMSMTLSSKPDNLNSSVNQKSQNENGKSDSCRPHSPENAADKFPMEPINRQNSDSRANFEGKQTSGKGMEHRMFTSGTNNSRVGVKRSFSASAFNQASGNHTHPASGGVTNLSNSSASSNRSLSCMSITGGGNSISCASVSSGSASSPRILSSGGGGGRLEAKKQKLSGSLLPTFSSANPLTILSSSTPLSSHKMSTHSNKCGSNMSHAAVGGTPTVSKAESKNTFSNSTGHMSSSDVRMKTQPSVNHPMLNPVSRVQAPGTRVDSLLFRATNRTMNTPISAVTRLDGSSRNSKRDASAAGKTNRPASDSDSHVTFEKKVGCDKSSKSSGSSLDYNCSELPFSTRNILSKNFHGSSGNNLARFSNSVTMVNNNSNITNNNNIKNSSKKKNNSNGACDLSKKSGSPITTDNRSATISRKGDRITLDIPRLSSSTRDSVFASDSDTSPTPPPKYSDINRNPIKMEQFTISSGSRNKKTRRELSAPLENDSRISTGSAGSVGSPSSLGSGPGSPVECDRSPVRESWRPSDSELILAHRWRAFHQHAHLIPFHHGRHHDPSSAATIAALYNGHFKIPPSTKFLSMTTDHVPASSSPEPMPLDYSTTSSSKS